MSAIPVYSIYCEAGGCRAKHTAALGYRASTATEARELAQADGWTRARRSGRLVDLCPTHAPRSAP